MPAPKGGAGRTPSRPSADKQPSPWIPGLVFVLLIGVVSTGVWMSRQHAVTTDPETLCLIDAPPPSIAVVLIDVTDALSEGERAQVGSEVERIRETLPRHGLLEVYAMGRSPEDVAQPRLSLCNPGRGSEVSSIYQNPELVERRWQQGFRDRLDVAMASVGDEQSGEQSLILEAIRSVALMRMGQAQFDGVDKQLLVFSDFLQHVPGQFSHYRTPAPDYAAFRATPYAASVQADLSGIGIRAFYIQRPAQQRLQGREHLQFWIDHFEASGGRVDSAKRIFGDS